MARALYWRLLDALVGVTDADYREAQQVLPFLDAVWADRVWRLSVRGRDGIERHPRVAQAVVDAWREQQKKKVWVIEVTLRTKGGTYKREETIYDRRGRQVATRIRRKVDRRPLFLKVRLKHKAPAPLPLHDYERMLRHITETGVVPEHVRLEIIDWEKGDGQFANSGTISRNMAVELQHFYAAAHHPNTVIQAAFVRPEEE